MNDIYQRVTDTIIRQLEVGTAPWIRPWSTESEPLPVNAATGHHYRGINTLVLGTAHMACCSKRNAWLTFNQAIGLGGHIRRGAKGTPVVFYMLEKDESKTEPTKRPLLRVFTVFNVEDTEGLPASYYAPAAKPSGAWQPDKLAEDLIQNSDARLRWEGSRAFYSPELDFIQLPAKTAFSEGNSCYATALHELTHWTGHASRCNRTFGKRFGDEPYAMEELVAELGAAFLCAHCRVDGELQHASYVQHWLAVLRADKRAIFTAATQAQRAADYVLSRGATALAA